MAIVDITKPMALDETLQGTNTKMDAVIQKLQGIIDALGLDTSVYKPKGNITCAELVPALLIDDNLGNVYNVTDNGTTTSDFVEGAGKPIHVGDNVAIVDVGTGGQNVYKFDLLAGMVDLTNYIQKSNTSGLVKNDGTIDTNDYAEKVAGATNGNLAGLDGNGNPTDSGWNGAKDTTSISGNPISISGLKSNQLAINPIITFEPIQAGSGTPSPSNIRAISGYDKVEALSCGKNLFDKSEVVLGGLDATTGAETSSTTTYRSGWIRVKASTTYVLSGFANVIRPYYYGQGGAFIERDSSTTASTFTTPSGCAYVRFQIASATWTGTTNPQLEENTTATTYSPYVNPTSISESLGQTVYGAKWYPRTGKLKVLGKAVDLGDLEWTYYQSSDFFYASSTSLSDVASSVSPSNSLCEIYPIVSAGQAGSPYILWNGTQLRIYYTGYTDATTFKNAMTGYKLVYPISNPFTIQLTPHEISLLKDYAYVSTNGTTIALDYHNGEMASLGDVEQLGETVNELGNKFASKSLSASALRLEQTYTSASNLFVVPEDGYIFCFADNVNSQAVWYFTNESGSIQNYIVTFPMAYASVGIFVKKGAMGYAVSNGAAGVAYRKLEDK